MVISAHCEPITKDRLSLKCKILSGWTLSKNANVEYHLNALQPTFKGIGMLEGCHFQDAESVMHGIAAAVIMGLTYIIGAI